MQNKITKKIEVVPYNPEWPQQFAIEAVKIREALGDNLIEIHHVGSTSIPGLSAKPFIDIIMAVQKIDKAIPALEFLGFEYRSEFSIPFQNYFTKKTSPRFNMHVYEETSPEITLNLLFRDYLRNHDEARDEYANLKANLLSEKSSFEKNNSKFTGYNLGKNNFITKILEKSGFNEFRLAQTNHRVEWQNYHRIRDEQIFSPINIIYNPNHPDIEAENHCHFILYKGTKIVSVAHVEFLNETDVAIRSLATDAPYQNRGCGKKMMEILEKWLKYQGRKNIKIHLNPRAEKFYRRLGYDNIVWDDKSINEKTINLGKNL